MPFDRIEIDAGCDGDPCVLQQPHGKTKAVVGQMSNIGVDIKRAIGRRDAIKPQRWQSRQQQIATKCEYMFGFLKTTANTYRAWRIFSSARHKVAMFHFLKLQL